MKKLIFILFALLFLVSCMPESKVPSSEVPPNSEIPQKDPYEESPLSSVTVEIDKPTKNIQGTWLMLTGGYVSDNLFLCFDYTSEFHPAVYAEKCGDLISNLTAASENQIIGQIWISGLADYRYIKYTWEADDDLDLRCYEPSTGKTYRHAMYKYSDSYIDGDAYDDTTLIYGLWVNEDRSSGVRFLSDGTLWIYKGESSEKCKWKDSDGNALYVMDSLGFSEKIPFVKIGENILVYNGEKLFKAK